jgi:L-lactate dehydrogenase
MKVSIIGTGRLGSTLAYTLAVQQLAAEIHLVDSLNPKKAKGHCEDLQHAITMLGPTKIFSGGYEMTADSDIIIIAAGISRKPNQSRMDLAEKNIEITRQIVSNILDYNQKAILILSNTPVELTTYVALKLSGFPRERVIGTGTLLDSVRFRFLLSEAANLDPESIEAIFIGEHGDNAVPLLSKVSVNGIHISEASDLEEKDILHIIQKVKSMGGELLELKGGSVYAPSMCIATIIDAILNNKHTIMPLSACLDGEYGFENLCLSVPVSIGSHGIEEIIEVKLTEAERQQLDISVGILRSEIASLE